MKLQYLDNIGFALRKALNFDYLLKKAGNLEGSNCEHSKSKLNAQSASFSILACIILLSLLSSCEPMPAFAHIKIEVVKSVKEGG